MLLLATTALLTMIYAFSPQASDSGNQPSSGLYPELSNYLNSLPTEWESLSPQRKEILDELAEEIRLMRSAQPAVQLTFICTHNSRRSHFGQIWASAAAAHVGLTGIHTFSGGTEATAFNPRAVAAAQRAGFQIEQGQGENPHYSVRFSDQAEALTCFSKKFDHSANPQKGFVAVMVCSEADAACPFVPGAEARIALPFIDPKVSDGSPEEEATYDLRCRQIAAEIYYVMSRVQQS